MALPIAHHEFHRKSAGFGRNGPDGSGGLKEKRFGLAPGGLCSGIGRMISTANLGFLWSQGHGFLVGL
ncbi:hypothetical protein A7Q09_08785 [Methylacidiphilum sp. Yel]|nr:hypothetical protein A7Q09_08785 [Methylacidiphilum sp. Yel]